MPKSNQNLTTRQEEALNFIREYIASEGAPPTLREIGGAMNISSPNGVKSLVEALERKGYLARKPGISRGLYLSGDNPHAVTNDNVAAIPLIGRVAAGAPILAEENTDGYIQVDESFLTTGETFALKVQGESMVDAGILDGDTVIARMQPTAMTGDVIVAVIENEATVKFYFPEQNRIRLEPANTYFNPILVDPESTPFRIAGKVIALIRKM